MKSWITPMLAVVLLLVLGTTGNAVEPSGPRDAAIDAIITLGGEIRFDGAAVSGAGGGGVEAVRLDRTGVTDAGLVHLKELTNVKTISLRFTKVTGDGFAHFKGLTNLTSLYLPGSTVRDIGLERLKNVPTLVNSVSPGNADHRRWTRASGGTEKSQDSVPRRHQNIRRRSGTLKRAKTGGPLPPRHGSDRRRPGAPDRDEQP